MNFFAIAIVTAIVAGDGGARFTHATQLEAQGDHEAAAQALEALANDLPNDAFADDALSEAALIYEQNLRRPADALRLLERLIAQYPDSRLTRRAENRRARLLTALSSGTDAYVEYQRLTSELLGMPAATQIRSLRAFLDKYPSFALRESLRMQLAAALARTTQIDAALAEYASIESTASTVDVKRNAHLVRGELAIDADRLAIAATLLAEDPNAALQKKYEVARARHRWQWIALADLALTFIIGLWLLGRAGLAQMRRSLPSETLYYLPVAALLIAAALTENIAIARATIALGIGGACVVTLFTALDRARTLSRRGRTIWLIALIGAVLSLFFAAIEMNGLAGLVIETFRHGPER